MSTLPTLQGFKPDPLLEKLPDSVQVYVVGGAVRDALLGIPGMDRDWVVTGAGVNDMLAAGFTPVGADFPVFLHPHTHEEYALARTERKSGHGYKGFVFHADPAVRLEDDLARRDFTVNAMAMTSSGMLIDPHGGYSDLLQKRMRHVSPAFVEDPLRVLRLARFLARFHEFTVAAETLALCQQLRESGELQHLVAERIFAELNKGFGESRPSRMMDLLTQLNAWNDLGGEIASQLGRLSGANLASLDSLSSAEFRWIYLLSRLQNRPSLDALAQAWRVPKDLHQAAAVFIALADFIQVGVVDAASFQRLFDQVDLYRKPARLAEVVRLYTLTHSSIKPCEVLLQAVHAVEAGQYKQQVALAIQQAQPGSSIPAVVAKSRLEWADQLIQGLDA